MLLACVFWAFVLERAKDGDVNICFIIYERISTLNKEQMVLTHLIKYPRMNLDAELSGSKCLPGISLL